MPALLAVAALAVPAGAVAQDNSGIGQYTESPPSVGGDGSSGSGADGGGSGEGVSSAAGSGLSSSDAAGSGVAGASGTGAGAGTNATGLSETGPNRAGELPRTGNETLILALFGALLVGSGIALRRASLRRT